VPLPNSPDYRAHAAAIGLLAPEARPGIPRSAKGLIKTRLTVVVRPARFIPSQSRDATKQGIRMKSFTPPSPKWRAKRLFHASV